MDIETDIGRGFVGTSDVSVHEALERVLDVAGVAVSDRSDPYEFRAATEPRPLHSDDFLCDHPDCALCADETHD